MLILAVDQGTTGTTAVLCNNQGKIVASAYREFRQIYPQPGWVEHDPLEIWDTVKTTITEVTAKCPDKIIAMGITNQRETLVVWDRSTGKPIYNAIVWQCRRTRDICENLQQHKQLVSVKTGLPLDAYFSGTKIKWILEQVKGYALEQLLCGTMDTWLIWNLSGGKVHATDYTNASRTLLFNIGDKRWDMELCDLLSVPMNLLPQVKASMDDYGRVTALACIKDVPILGVAGDQQAALFAQGCFQAGKVKNTYGTGCFVMMNTGQQRFSSNKGLITTLAINDQGTACYALEGSIFIAGAAVQWLRDELQLIQQAADSETAANMVKDNGGVYLVPAFVGLGTPYWDMDARGVLVGLTRGSNRQHIIRAALEAMAYQTYDVLTLIEQETQLPITELTVDGGAVANNFLMQFQADILHKTVIRPANIEATAVGAAYLAGLNIGLWKSTQELLALRIIDKKFTPCMEQATREIFLKGWRRAIKQALTK